MQFATLFKLMCKEKGVSQLCALSELGLSRTAPQNWKTGTPNADTLQKIADYFGLSVDALLRSDVGSTISDVKNSVVLVGNTGNNTVANGDIRMDAPALTEQEAELLRIFSGLSVRSKNKVLTMVYELEDEELKTK